MPHRAHRRAVATVFLISTLWAGSAALLPSPASANSNEASSSTPACTPAILYSNDFETGSGLADWTVELDFGANTDDWRGIQSCPAHSGSGVFRFGGPACGQISVPFEQVVAFPKGTGAMGGIVVPAGTSPTRLSFWHHWNIEQGDAWLKLSVDGSSRVRVPSSAFIAGTGYTEGSGFTGQQSTFVNSVVDLDAACAIVLGSGGCAGHRIELGFAIWSSSGGPGVEWALDDVTVTACATTSLPLSFYTVTPCRLVDTRNANGPLGGPALQPGAIRPFTLTGICGVPATAKALSLNVTVTQPSAAGFLTLYPGGQPTPPTSSINYSLGQTRANNAVLPLEDGTGILQIYSAGGSAHVILDVNGYFQ